MNKQVLKGKNIRLKIMIFALIVFAFIVAMMPGSDGDGDVTDKLVLISVGVDYEDGMLTLSGTTVLPKAGADGGQVVTVPVSASGESLMQCISNLEKKTGKSAELGLCGVVVIGENLAGEGVKTTAAIMLSDSIVSPGAYVVQTEGHTAEEVIRASTQFADSSAGALTQIIKDAKKSTGSSTVSLLEFVSQSFGKSHSAYAPVLDFEKAEKVSGGSAGEGVDPKDKFQPKEVSKTAMYVDGKMVGILSGDASRGFSLSNKHITKGEITVTDFTVADVDVGTISGLLGGLKYGLKVDFSNGKPTAVINVGAEMKSIDRERVNAVAMEKNLSTEDVEKAYKDNFKREITSWLEKAVAESKRTKCDIFGIEQDLYRFKTSEYKKFVGSGKTVLDEAEIGIKVEVTLS